MIYKVFYVKTQEEISKIIQEMRNKFGLQVRRVLISPKAPDFIRSARVDGVNLVETNGVLPNDIWIPMRDEVTPTERSHA